MQRNHSSSSLISRSLSSIPVTKSPPSGGTIRKDSISSVANVVSERKETGSNQVTNPPTNEEVGILKQFMIKDISILQVLKSYNRCNNFHQGISVIPEADESRNHEKVFRSVRKSALKVADIINVIQCYETQDFTKVESVSHTHLKNVKNVGHTHSKKVFPDLVVRHTPWLDPNVVTNAQELIGRIRSVQWLMKHGIDPHDLIKRHIISVERMEKRIKMLRECGMRRLTIHNLDQLVFERSFVRVTSMIYPERVKFGLDEDPNLLIESMINSIDSSLISNEQKSGIIKECIPYSTSLSVNSIKIKAIETFMRMNDYEELFPQIDISQIDTEYFDLNQAFGIMKRLVEDKDCSENASRIELPLLFNHYTVHDLDYLLETLPRIGCHHISKFMRPHRFHLIKGRDRIDTIASRLKYLTDLGFNDYNIGSNYQILHIKNSNLRERMHFWFDQMGKDAMIHSHNSLRIIVNHALATSRHTIDGKESVFMLTKPILKNHERDTTRVKNVSQSICSTLGWNAGDFTQKITSDPNYIESYLNHSNAIKVFTYLVSECGFYPDAVRQKAYILLQDHDKLKQMYESRLIADPDFDTVQDDSIRLDLLCYHLTSFKDHFTIEHIRHEPLNIRHEPLNIHHEPLNIHHEPLNGEIDLSK